MALGAKPHGDFVDDTSARADHVNDQINALYTWGQGQVDAHIAASSAVHGVAGSVVGTTDTQTLSGKTHTSPIMQTSIVLKQASANYTMLWADPPAARQITIPDPLGDAYFEFGGQETMGASATMTPGKHSVMCTAAGITVTLPTACVGQAGYKVRVKDTSMGAGASPITIVGEGGETIDNAASVQIVGDGESFDLEAYNNKWWIC